MNSLRKQAERLLDNYKKWIKERQYQCCIKDNLHVHHIVTFANKKLRADIDNLVLLCAKCHRFVHSKKNNNREYTREEVRGC